VRGADGEVITGSIAELTKVSIGGNEQWLEIRGASAGLPVLLYVSGGPGQSDLAFSRALFADLTRNFLVVGWDQRGNGKSYADWDAAAMTLDQAVADTIAVTNYLRQRFDEDRIYLLGESWGSTLAVLAAQRQPELYYALIGSGQMVSQRETDRLIYQDLLAYAEEQENVELATSLRAYGPPPYDTLWGNVLAMEHYDALAGAYTPPQSYIARGEGARLGFYGIMGSEYTAIEKFNVLRGLIETFEVMYPQLQSIDFRTDVPALDVPIYLLAGEHELRGRRELADEWFTLVSAPDKQMFRYENAGHSVAFEQADELHRILLDIILPTTYPDA
jgi:pimeloyl-ACP methyl ester carboxylesterase